MSNQGKNNILILELELYLIASFDTVMSVSVQLLTTPHFQLSFHVTLATKNNTIWPTGGMPDYLLRPVISLPVEL